jgi:hypothetical protein
MSICGNFTVVAYPDAVDHSAHENRKQATKEEQMSNEEVWFATPAKNLWQTLTCKLIRNNIERNAVPKKFPEGKVPKKDAQASVRDCEKQCISEWQHSKQ